MSEQTFTLNECLIVIAYFCYIQSVNQEQADRFPVEKEESEFGPPSQRKRE